MNAEWIEFIIVVVGALIIFGVVVEAWNLIEHRREDLEEDHERQLLRRRYRYPAEDPDLDDEYRGR